MNKKVGVLLVHGMGTLADDFAHDMVYELRERISGRGLNRDEIAWQGVYWAPLMSAREHQIWVDLAANNDLNWAKLRKFFLNAFGTMSSYHASGNRPDSLYHRIHGVVHQGLQQLRAKLGDQDKPLIIVAHSVGSVFMSNYIWDRQKGYDQERYGNTPFERMETMTGLVTLGSNIPLFCVDKENLSCIEFPPPTLTEPLRKKAKWLNLYDSDDVLGWPLKPLSPSYSATVSEDIEVSVGNILTSWNPANHSAYWSDETVIKPMVYLLSTILEATHAPPTVTPEAQSVPIGQ
ncbi:hypothetical protein M1B72_14015 [Geomonas paludis]|uniref:Chemotaxis protein n=1 Tax=Geomonas paludis TaxID=2740185 RepID=A0ABY4LAD3_9BACT|nr:hypothetical protein [Geomonas paludis]UPU34560.1 hypothetical protein M1B72_14015 [Geomonas paludis]